ncbi:Prp18-domain-containing protein [Dacryopinax primogenitus]|uniref:Pre-mRNA-splicing factor 18 n=1 Tax=Dacryopinax primogenitus (strain DJM 731) TaxID=1858805 RepID=M5GG14_DACPD|nr:Prp18-domain-containing protein [Dacryopinax primogenitus]EJU04693.1 Prp18-domain-containing protein [Dacryopinax primogenitus]
MDFLAAELASKRKALEDHNGRPKKYMRRGEVEAMEREKELARKKQLLKTASPARSPAPSASPAPTADTGSPAPEAEPKAGGEMAHLSTPEVIRRLRQKGQPVTMFGETERERRLRLRALELMEERGGDRAGQNDFKRALEVLESAEGEAKAKQTGSAAAPAHCEAKGGKDEGRKREQDDEVQLEWIKDAKEKLYPAIYFALKKKLKEWEVAMAERPESIKRTAQGKLAAATQVQSAEYLKPLFKQLRTKTMDDDVLGKLAEIVYHMQHRQYQRANDAYLRLSIGNAAWPIGVTMVGIHERSAREKISTDQVAHVLNDEVSRKYIQSVKRLLTFAQTKYPPEDISQLMG